MMITAEYIWLDGSLNIRSKVKVVEEEMSSLGHLPVWSCDGSSCGMAAVGDSEVVLRPVYTCEDPFRSGSNILVLCDTYNEQGPCFSNFRYTSQPIVEKTEHEQPLFGLEEEYYIMEGFRPTGWHPNGQLPETGNHYCSAGSYLMAKGRKLAESHIDYCIKAGIKIAGLNAEVTTGQWEFEIGPCTSQEIGDEMIVARFILLRAAEEMGLGVTFNPKPFDGHSGSGCHINYSTEDMRSGRINIEEVVQSLSHTHQAHIALYGDNSKRLCGNYETSRKEIFTYGVGDRSASIRIPLQTANEGKGYIEDRRPAANIDPYVTTAAMLDSTLLQGQHLQELYEQYENLRL